MDNLKIYKGGDVTKMPVIGLVRTKSLGGVFEPAEYNVVGVIEDGKGLVYVCDYWYKEYKRIPQLIHSNLVAEFVPKANEETSATGGPSVGGMGDVVNAQPSGLAGQTIGPSWASGGGKAGSGDVSIPYNPSGSNRVFQKIPVAAMGVNHGSMTGKKSRVKKLDLKALKDIFAKKQDYTAGQGNVAGKVMNFDDFQKKAAEKKLKKEIQVTTPGLKKSIKKFEDFSLEISPEGGEEEYDPYSYSGCGCCPVCTGEADCDCGCPECNCPADDEEFCDSCDCAPCKCGDSVTQTSAGDEVARFSNFEGEDLSISESLKYHIKNGKPVTESIFNQDVIEARSKL